MGSEPEFDLLEDMAIPEGEVRDYWLDGLANIIRRRGFETFLLAPILTKDERFFPDRWEKSPRGIRVLLRRLMVYAGLEQYQVMLHVYAQRPRMVGAHAPIAGDDTAHAAAWYAGLEEGVAHFGIDEGQLRQAEVLVGTLGHEVAHLYREHHDLVVSDRDTEEALTDLTAIYLGFGLFLFESSYAFRTGGYSESGDRLLWERSVHGYLTLGAIALYFAAQLACREFEPRELRAFCKELPATQAELLQQAYRELRTDSEGLRRRLGLPSVSECSEPAELERFLAPLDEEDDAAWIREGSEYGILEDEDLADTHADESALPHESTESERAHAVPGRVSHAPALVLATIGFACGAYFGLEIGIALAGAGAAVGWLISSRYRTPVCSRCGAEIHSGASFCPRCDASITWGR
jgi:hypothetical protein